MKKSLIILISVLSLFVRTACAEFLCVSGPQLTIKSKSEVVAVGKEIIVKAVCENLPEDITVKSTLWKSSDDQKATVKRGKIKGVSEGNVVITCVQKLSNGEQIEASTHVLVDKRIRRLEADKNMVMNVGERKKLNLRIDPETASPKAVSFISSNEAIASIDQNGFITANKQGSCTLIAKALDGSGEKAKVNLYVPSVAIEKTDYIVDDCLGITIVAKYHSNPNNIGTKREGDCFTSKTTYDSKQKEIRINVSPIKPGTGRFLIYNIKSGEKFKLNIEVTDKAVEPREISIYDKNTIIMKADGITVTNVGAPEIVEHAPGMKKLNIPVIIENTSDGPMGIYNDLNIINGTETRPAYYRVLRSGEKIKDNIPVYHPEHFGIIDLNDIHKIQARFYTFVPEGDITLTDNIQAILNGEKNNAGVLGL